jgi:hypothetical protein
LAFENTLTHLLNGVAGGDGAPEDFELSGGCGPALLLFSLLLSPKSPAFLLDIAFTSCSSSNRVASLLSLFFTNVFNNSLFDSLNDLLELECGMLAPVGFDCALVNSGGRGGFELLPEGSNISLVAFNRLANLDEEVDLLGVPGGAVVGSVDLTDGSSSLFSRNEFDFEDALGLNFFPDLFPSIVGCFFYWFC